MASFKPPKLGKLVSLTWVDSARHVGTNDGWVRREDLEHVVMEMVSVGWVWAVDEHSVTLAPHTDAEHTQAYGVLSIPCCAITRVVALGT